MICFHLNAATKASMGGFYQRTGLIPHCSRVGERRDERHVLFRRRLERVKGLPRLGFGDGKRRRRAQTCAGAAQPNSRDGKV